MSSIGVTEPFGAAIGRTVDLLFKPFDRRKWLGIAFVVWLTTVGQGSGLEFFQPLQFAWPYISWGRIMQWVGTHQVQFFVYFMLLAVAAFGVYWLCCVLRAWGHLGLIRQIVENDGAVRRALGPQREMARKLGWFFVLWDCVVYNILAVGVLCAAALALPDLVHSWADLRDHLAEIAADFPVAAHFYHATGWSIAAVIAVPVVTLLFMLCVMGLGVCLNELTIPIMYHTKLEPREAFGYTLTHVVFPNFGACVGYFLMNLVAGMVAGTAGGAAICVVYLVTCGVGLVLSYVPVLGNLPIYGMIVLALPVFVFLRVYSLSFLEQFEGRFGIAWVSVPRGGFPVEADGRR
jgi:hypothetical protein